MQKSHRKRCTLVCSFYLSITTTCSRAPPLRYRAARASNARPLHTRDTRDTGHSEADCIGGLRSCCKWCDTQNCCSRWRQKGGVGRTGDGELWCFSNSSRPCAGFCSCVSRARVQFCRPFCQSESQSRKSPPLRMMNLLRRNYLTTERARRRPCLHQ